MFTFVSGPTLLRPPPSFPFYEVVVGNAKRMYDLIINNVTQFVVYNVNYGQRKKSHNESMIFYILKYTSTVTYKVTYLGSRRLCGRPVVA